MDADVRPELFAALSADPLARLLGIRILTVTPGSASAAMTVTADLLNATGTGHGGATMALIDVVHAAVSNSHGTVAVAQEVHTEFLAATRLGDELHCAGVELARSRRTAVYRIDVRAAPQRGGDEARLIATALARVYRKDESWPIGSIAVEEDRPGEPS